MSLLGGKNARAQLRQASQALRPMGKNPRAIRILIADHQPMFRDGLRILLEADKDYRVVGGTGNSAEAVELAVRLKPDILLLDLAMAYHPSLHALRELACSSPEVRILLLATAIEKDQIVDALHLGVRGVLLRESTTQLLRKSIRTVMSGQYWLGREGVSDVAQRLRGLVPSLGEEARRKNFGLTRRELEVVASIVAGYTNKEIAQKFSLSQQTVKHHLTKVFDKLGVFNRLELALFALHHRLVRFDYTERTRV